MRPGSTCRRGANAGRVERDRVEPTKDLAQAKMPGTSFFGMDERGLPVSGFDAVVDLYAEVDASDWTNLVTPVCGNVHRCARFIVKSATNGEPLFRVGRMGRVRAHRFINMHGKHKAVR